jgi:uncharacterized protein (TIGR00251 family)
VTDTVLTIKVVPRSSVNEIAGFEGDTLRVKVKSAPVDGRANRDLIELLSRHLGVRKDKVEITSGFRSRRKTITFHDISREDLVLLLTR